MDNIFNLKTFFYENIDGEFENKEISYYLVNLYCKSNFNNLSRETLIIYYIKAKESNDFIKFQNLGDWIIFCETLFIQHLKNASKSYYHDMARTSYLQCFKLMGKKIKVYEELADDFPTIIEKLQNQFSKFNKLD